MKTRLIILLLAISYNCALSQPKYDTLYNSTIITLSKIGLPPSTIISKIQTSITSFDVSTNALIDLSKNGVNGDVIAEMMKRNDNANTTAVKEINSTNPNAMHKPGIYYYNPQDASNPLKKINPTVISTNKEGSFGESVAKAYSYGIAKTTAKSYISGASSRTQITEANPVFYFYFKNEENASADNWFFASATSPNEFVLVWLYKKEDGREMRTGSSNNYGGSTGIPEKDKVQFDITEESEGIYKVSFSKPLKPGDEYCFMYASSAPTRYSNNKVFDFGIKK